MSYRAGLLYFRIMDPLVKRLFTEAASLPPAARAAFLDRHCPDATLREEVLSLLEFDESSTTAIGHPVQAVLENMLAAGGAPGLRIGAFELGPLLGSGGMGRVYEAHRVDGEVRQKVAIKIADLPLKGPARAEVLERFHRERQMLASLRHPYIASLIDAGTTAEGVPYAVLEQVDGVAIDEYCERQGASQATRIRLVLKLCEAVRFAHRNLIVHRDIKPANVLIAADGTPKLLDFGIAKDLSGTADPTRMPALTPEYASPEQAGGLAATVATDVYGLGGLLYRLLLGVPPRRVADAAPAEWIRQILDRDVLRPSALDPKIGADLENILLKALHREPDRRYQSVPELADDLERFLNQQPVLATPDSLGYRASCFLRRHWMGLAAAALVSALLGAATVVSVHERRLAQQRSLETRQLAGRLIFDLHDEIGKMPGATRAKEKLAATASEYLEKLAPNASADPELAWELLNAYGRLSQTRGGANSSTGDTRSALEYARRTLAMGRIVESRGDLTTDRLQRLFALYDGLCGVFTEGQLPAEELETVTRLLALAPRLDSLRQARAYSSSARYHDRNTTAERAAQDLDRAVTLLRGLNRQPAPPEEVRSQFAVSLNSLGRTRARLGDFTGASAAFEESIAVLDPMAAQSPNNAALLRSRYFSHLWMADTLAGADRFNTGRLREGEKHYRTALDTARRLVALDPHNEMAKLDAARAAGKLGSAIASSRPAESLALMDQANESLAQTSFGNRSGREMRLAYLRESVAPLAALGRFEQARAHLAEARRIAREISAGNAKAWENELADILRFDAIWMFAAGQTRAALDAAERQWKHLQNAPTPGALADSWLVVDVLERIQTYARTIDPAARAEAAAHLERVWAGLARRFPQSEFLRARARSGT